MSDPVLERLLSGNATHADRLDHDHFDAVLDGQKPPAVSICCSDSRVSQEGMFAVDEPGWLFTPSNIGNQAWDTVDGERVVDGNLLYPIANTGTRTVAVVGHTGCGAVTAADRAARGEAADAPAGIAKYVEMLVPVVEAALESGAVDPDLPDDERINRLVEANVDRQVAFLREAPEVPEGVSVYGFVYDLHSVYGEVPGRAYLTNLDGTRDPDAIREQVPEGYASWVRRLTT